MNKNILVNLTQARLARPFYRAATAQRRIAHGSAVVGCNDARKAVIAVGSGAERNGKLREISLFPDLLAWSRFRWNQMLFIMLQLKSTIEFPGFPGNFPGVYGGEGLFQWCRVQSGSHQLLLGLKPGFRRRRGFGATGERLK